MITVRLNQKICVLHAVKGMLQMMEDKHVVLLELIIKIQKRKQNNKKEDLQKSKKLKETKEKI